MKLKVFLIICFALIAFDALCEEAEQHYRLELSYSGSFKYMVDVKYENLSDEAHCIRSADILFDHIGDFLVAHDGKGKPIEFIGTFDDSKLLMWPSAYSIIPPGGDKRSSFYLDDGYKVKNKEVTFTLSLPVIPCSIVTQKYIRIPPLSSLKEQKNSVVALDKNLFESAYKEWLNSGFLANSNTLIISN